jgi:integrase
MARRKLLTDEGVAALKPKSKRYAHPDPELPSHYIRVTPSGSKSFIVVVRDREGNQKWETIGKFPTYPIDAARKRAGEIIRARREGRSAPESFEVVSSKWMDLHCKARGLRSVYGINRLLQLMLREWTGRQFASIGRSDVTRLLDKIEEKNGRRQANYCLAIFSSMANWFTAREDDYRSPIVKGMRRGTTTKRDRILNDDELRAIWKAAEANGTFGALIRVLLLTGQRREKVASMRWEDISIDGTWTIPTEDREKGNAGSLVLPALALDIIKAQPRFESNPYVFASRVSGHVKGWSKSKDQFDAKIEGVEPWVLHDLRRTARSLMARAGVRPDIAERVLGHAIKGVEGIYDRHSYREEKANALKALAGLIDNILRPADEKVRRVRN